MVDYDEVFSRLAEFIGREGRAAEELAAIPVGRHNHALAAGIGASQERTRTDDW